MSIIDQLSKIKAPASENRSDKQSIQEAKYFKKKKDYDVITLDALKNGRYYLNTRLRLGLAIWAASVVTLWLFAVAYILMNNNECFGLSDSVLITVLTTTTIQVLGIIAIALRDIFNGNSEDKIS